MKILLVLDQFDGATNGNTNSARRLRNTLIAHGHEVRVAASGDSREGEKYGFGKYEVPVFGPLIAAQGFTFARVNYTLMKEAVAWADVVHVMMPFFVEHCAIKEARRQNKPLTGAFHVQPENIWFSVHLGNFMPLINFTYFFFRRYIFRYIHHVHCPSNMIRQQLERHHYKNEFHVISNGIESDVVYHKNPRSPEFEGKILVVMSGRYSGEKRQDVLIDAVKKSRYKDRIVLYLAGQGPMKKTYEKLCADLPNKAVMKFLTKEELMSLFGQADIYVHTSDAEIEAMSCMEAFASGLVPIIADSPRSATPQFALDERSLFRPGDSSDLASRIDWWIEHESERRKMEHKYAELADKYRLDDCVMKMEEMFRAAIEETAGQEKL